jgi:hypothetical protein
MLTLRTAIGLMQAGLAKHLVAQASGEIEQGPLSLLIEHGLCQPQPGRAYPGQHEQ